MDSYQDLSVDEQISPQEDEVDHYEEDDGTEVPLSSGLTEQCSMLFLCYLWVLRFNLTNSFPRYTTWIRKEIPREKIS